MNGSDLSAGKTAPSAPPLEQSAPMEQQREMVIPLTGAATNNIADQPPPSYQEALNYAPAPPYPNYQPNNFPSAPIPNVSSNVSQQIYPPYPNYATGANTIPSTQPAITTHIHHHTTVVPTRQNACSFCPGTIDRETDVCCLLCLILLTIFTFPLGLVFLFCIPCTIRTRCNACRRIYNN